MSFRVDPAELRRYSKQLHRNADEFDTLSLFCESHCADTNGLTGMLWASGIPAVRGFAETQRRLLPAGREYLHTAADLLDLTARRYAEGDRASADRMWTVNSSWRPGGPPGRPSDHPGDYSDPAIVDPEPPQHREELPKKVERANSLIKEIDHWLQKVAPDLSLRDRVMPWLAGDFGRIREIADGYAALSGEAGVMAIHDNVIHGMESLVGAWEGDAARAFDYHIRVRWHTALAGEASICRACKEALEWLAQEAENTFLLLETLLITALLAVGAKVVRIVGAALSGVGLAKAAQWLTELYHWFHQLVDAVKLIFRLIPAAWRRLEEVAEAMSAEVPALVALMRGDLAATRG